MTKGDIYTKEIIKRILKEGRREVNPRPKYADGESAYTYSVNHGMTTYDLSKGESPLITLRPIAVKSAIAELLWIYRDQSNDLVRFDELLGKKTWEEDHKINNWWEEWALRDENNNYILNDEGHPTIGACYGETIRRHHIMDDFLNDLEKDPDGRRHITNMWQVDDFKEKHGLKPCAFQTVWNVRHENDGNYLDMCLFQRSSDFMAAGCINQVQYMVFLMLIAKKYNYIPGRFTWFYDNIQIYDRHISQAKELLNRESVDCNPTFEIDDIPFENIMPDNIHVKDYPRELIKKQNPQLKFDLGI